MEIQRYYYQLFWGLIALCLLLFYIRRKKRIRSFLLGSFTGIASLIVLHNYGNIIGCTPPLSISNIVLCGLLGIPGTALVVLSELFL